MLLEIEVSNDRNANYFCLPLGRRFRGKLDFLKANDREALAHAREYPAGIPGHRLTLDTDKAEVIVSDPLHETANEAVRDKLSRKYSLDTTPARETIGRVDVPSLLYWLKRGVESGLLKLVRGAFPEKIDGSIKRRYLYGETPDKAEEDRQIKRQELAAKLAMMNERQRAEYDRLLAELP